MKIKAVSPIFGFEKIKEYSIDKIDDFFSILSADDISFTLINPKKLREYDFEIPSFYKELLNYPDDKITPYCIVVLQNPLEESAINFLAPILINEEKKVLVQVALDENRYSDYLIADKIKRYL